MNPTPLLPRIFLAIAALLGGLAVSTGAFASHALNAQLSARSLEIFETAARYQMYHALALGLVAVLLSRSETAQLALGFAGWAFMAGMALFCGSLYGFSLTGIKVLGAITPLGGIAFILGWVGLLVAAWRFS